MNSVTVADYDFTITPTSLTKGAILQARIAMICDDDATAVTGGAVFAIKVLRDIR